MDAPLNEKIERALKRKAARKKNDSNFLPVLSLHEQVLSLVKDANSNVSEERHVTPRSALIVMNRSLADLSTLEDDARNFAVLKEVSRFLNVATKTFTASQTDNTDLLVAGHPLSALNASISTEEFLKKNAKWIAADPSIDESIRPLVASAHAAFPGSIEREHAFARLAANKTLLASYFKLDSLSAIVASFSDGNSSAARRARVALQWRDKKGRWVEMGRGVNFRFRLPGGSIQVGSGTYVGAGGDSHIQNTSKGPSLVSDSGLIEVSGVPGIRPGLYVIKSNNAAVYQARIPGHAAPEKPSFKDQFSKDVPSLKDLLATRRDAPIGWHYQNGMYISDDNYAVVIDRSGRPHSVLRLDANGRPTGEAIARVSSWAEANAAMSKDEPAFDKYIAAQEAKAKEGQLPLGKMPGTTAKDVISPQDILKMQEQRMQENKAIDAGKPAPTPLGNNDLNGNPVPDGWVRDANNDRSYTRQMPQRDGGTYPVIAYLNQDGTYIAGHAGSWIPEPGTDGRGGAQKFDSWNQIETQGLPGLVEYLNNTFTKDNPIEFTPSKETVKSKTVKKVATVPSNNKSNAEKVVNTSAPTSPALFPDFTAPNGAFKLNTANYDVQGRVDEASKDFTDNPKKLATKFTPQELVQALSQALLGNSTDAAIAEILNANVDSNNDMVDPAAVPNNVDIPQVNVGQPSGAGQLEFSAGAEYVPAEALFNAIWQAGLDPNRVIANIYDSANGNNDNLNKLVNAQGGKPSANETQLVDSIMQEIRQLKDATKPGDNPIANQKDTNAKPEPLPGKLIENLPIDFQNPDYYIPDPNAYIPSQATVDNNGYTDNPQILAQDYYTADLIEQLLSGITDGSGAALLSFDNITVEVPIESMRDALQYQGVNTNQILLDLKKESNNMDATSPSPSPSPSPSSSESPTLQAHSQMIKDLIEQAGNTVGPETANKIRDAIDQKGLLDWSEANKSEIIDAIAEVAGPAILNPASTPAAERRFPPTTGERQAIETPAAPAPAPTPQAGPPTAGQRQAQEPVQPAETVSVDSPVANNPTPVYPGPENRGYHPDNTVLDITGKVMGKGTRIRASRDGRMGTVIAVQNIDSRTGERTPYVRVRFDDGSVSVRSALKVRATGEAQQVAPTDAQRQAPTPAPVPDVSARLDAPVLNPGAIATEGNIQGVNNLGTTPDRLKEFTNSDAKQSDYSVWGLRAGEIARAGQDRVTLESIKQAAIDHQLAILEFRAATAAQKEALSLEVTKRKEILDAMMKDTYGVRDGVTFGKNGYSLSFGGSNVFLSGTAEELQAGNQPISLSISMNVLDSNGRNIGTINRTISGKQVTDPNTGANNFEWQVKNNYLAINNAKDKKSGFATAYNRFMEDWYIANSVKEIHVQAAGGGSYQGGFVWALNGFNWETPRGAENEVSTRLRMMRRLTTNKGEIAQIERLQAKADAAKLRDGGLDLNKAPTPMELALVGWYPGAKTWTGKDLMARNGWMGIKRLDPAAKEQVQAINYDQIRAARKRVETKENRPNVGREFVMTVNSNEFQNNNPELGPYLADIRDVLQNNKSLAVLSPAAKAALNTYVTKQLLTNEGRVLPMQDIFQLRKALHAEAVADNPLLNSTDFGVGKDLANATIEDVARNNVKGFDIKRLGMHESGYNETWLATHIASGQRFYVKKDDLATNYDINGPLSEIAATNIARGLGFEGAYNTLAGATDPNVLVMQEAGATLPLGSELKVASKVYNGSSGSLVALDGTRISFNADNFISKMHTPEDAVRVVLLDLLINNQDRHNGNILYALDGVNPSQIRIFPIDHSLSSFALKPGDRNQYLFDAILGEGDGKIYDLTMPALTRAMKQDDLLALFRNEANALRESLKDGTIQLSGKELDMVVAQWGSLNNYRAAINERLDAMLKPNGAVHARFLRILKPSFWN
jgi:hypothetical protein